MCTDVSRPGSSGSATPSRSVTAREALLRRDLAIQGVVRVAVADVDLDQRIGEGVEGDPMPRAGGFVQGVDARRKPPAGDVRAREALVVEIDERVEEVEDDGLDLHPGS